MLEIAPGVYTSPRMTQGIRERIWDVVSRWYYELGNGSIVMTWRDTGAPGEQRIRTLGEPPKDIVDADGVYLGALSGWRTGAQMRKPCWTAGRC